MSEAISVNSHRSSKELGREQQEKSISEIRVAEVLEEPNNAHLPSPQWRPIAEPLVWNVEDRVASMAIQLIFFLGWAVLLISSFLINHFELFGLSQVYHRLVGRTPKAQEFRTPLLYRHVRHPLYLGFILGSWATPKMSLGHLLFAVGMTGYILIGIYFEERDLVSQFGERYLRYRERVGMLLPWPRKVRPRENAAP